MPRLLRSGEERRLNALERKAARQQLTRERGNQRSKRQKRTYRQIAAMRARQARRREDWLHKTTTRLAKKHGVIAVEDLNITRMTRSARGTVEQPGANVRAKARLNRSILGMAWGAAGGHVSFANRIDQATFHCEVCAHVANADTNAAQVVLQRGLTALSGATPGCGGTAREARQPRHNVNRRPERERVGGHQYTMPALPTPRRGRAASAHRGRYPAEDRRRRQRRRPT
jgi:transposase